MAAFFDDLAVKRETKIALEDRVLSKGVYIQRKEPFITGERIFSF